MNAAQTETAHGRVASLHLHPSEPGEPLEEVKAVELVAGKGIIGDRRYFGKLSRDTGQPSRRQVSLIEREQIAEHVSGLGLQRIAPGAVRSNIETTGVQLVTLLGKEIQIGEAVLFLHSQRDPCAKMDALCQGLHERMTRGRQGVLAEVRQPGKVCVGDAIRVLS